LYVLAICEIFLSSKGGAWPKWPNGKYAYEQCDKYEVSVFTISCFTAIIMLSRVILTKMAIAHALCDGTCR